MLLGKRYNSVYTFYPTKKFPLLGERIWDTYQQLVDYINDPDSLAIEGICMSVIADDDSSKNGMYYISKVAREEGETGVAEKLGAGGSGGGGGGDVTFSLASNATNAVSLTINGTTQNITAATLRSSLNVLGKSENAASATKLNDNTAYTIWGNTFFSNGKPANVSNHLYMSNGKAIYFADSGGSNRAVVQLNTSNGFLVGQGTASAGYATYMHGHALYFKANYGNTLAMAISSGGKVGVGTDEPKCALDVNGELNSTNFMQGSVISSDPTSSFQTSIFGAADSAYCKMRLVRKGTDTDGINKAYAPILAMKTYDTHAFLAISYNTANKCYIGGGTGDAISWSAIIFHNNMDLIPKWNNNSSLGSSSNRWKEVHAVSIKIGDATITWDSAAGMLKADKGIYSSGDLVAGK